METTAQKLTRMALLMAAHENVTHWAISSRIFKKGDFFGNFLKGARRGCSADNAEKAFLWFDENWPVDLAWPEGIARPSRQSEDAA